MGLWKRLMRRLRPEPIRMWPLPKVRNIVPASKMMPPRAIRCDGGYRPEPGEKPISEGYQPNPPGERPDWIIPPDPPQKAGWPSGVLSTTQCLSKCDQQKLKEDWEDRTTTPEQFAADHGMKWEQWTTPA